MNATAPRKKGARKRRKHRVRQFGGRATAGGVNYEARIAAFVASHVLCGDRAVLWQGITGHDIAAVTLQAREAVDDIVLTLRPSGNGRIFVSAKSRSKGIPLTKKSAAFTETVRAFVTQFRQIAPEHRAANGFVWAIPSTAGAAATNHLTRVLDAHRMEASDASFSTFFRSRSRDQEKAITAFLNLTKTAWKQESGALPQEDELREFLRRVRVEIYDFGGGQHHERIAEGQLRSHVLHEPAQSHQAWRVLEHFFGAADELGITATRSSLRQTLTAADIRLNASPDYAADVDRLHALTRRNMERLRRHTTLSFGARKSDSIHLSRSDDLDALSLAIAADDLLLTGDPGCGKSGIIYSLVERLEAQGVPVILLLAEEISAPGQQQGNRLPGLDHSLDDILSNWPTGARGYLITDALDAVREPETQKAVRKLLEEVRQGDAKWAVFASVREFDLKHSRELREMFPGDGFKGHASPEFASVAHFFLSGVSDADLAYLATRRPQISPFLKSAQENPRSLSLHKSPFYLSLAADLLRHGVTPTRLADWNSPAVLFRKFWNIRVEEGAGSDERERTLTSICREMVGNRTMALSTTQLLLATSELAAIRELKSRGILQSPILRYGTSVQSDLIRFAHHLLHDYAIARTYIPTDGSRFADFAIREPLLPVFYRQSFMFALEELWDSDVSRTAFWDVALKLEGVPTLHGLTRILAPILAARRVETIVDLQPLLAAVATSKDVDSPAQKALRHLASGMQDASTEAIAAATIAWADFAARLADLMPSLPYIEGLLST